MVTALIRTAILYILLIVGLRLTGKRQIGELEPIELVLAMLLSDLSSVPMQDFAIPLINGVVPIITLLCLSTLLSHVNLRSVRLRRLICGEPTLIISDGRVMQDAMRRNRLTLDELMEELRGQGIHDLRTVKHAVLETSGKLSVLLYPQHQPVTPEQLKLPVEDDVVLPTVIINDGRVLRDNLFRCGLNENWLKAQLQSCRASDPSEIFLLSVGPSGDIICLSKETNS